MILRQRFLPVYRGARSLRFGGPPILLHGAKLRFPFLVRELSLLFSSTSWQEIVSTCVFINIVARKKLTFFLHVFSTTSWH
jgi:hypothetical protein